MAQNESILRAEELDAITFGQFEPTTIAHVVDSGKQRQWLREAIIVLYQNNMIPDPHQEDQEMLDPKEVANTMETDNDGVLDAWTLMTQEDGIYTHNSVAIQYGNCTSCFRAYPLGFKCTHPMCNGKRSHRIYFVYDIDDWLPKNREAGRRGSWEMLQAEDRKFANPIGLSWNIMGHVPWFTTEQSVLDKMEQQGEYFPIVDDEVGRETHLILEINYLLSLIEQWHRTPFLIDNLEQVIHDYAKTLWAELEPAVDKEMMEDQPLIHYTGPGYQRIMAARRVRHQYEHPIPRGNN
jgi:hypothetical protein